MTANKAVRLILATNHHRNSGLPACEVDNMVKFDTAVVLFAFPSQSCRFGAVALSPVFLLADNDT